MKKIFPSILIFTVALASSAFAQQQSKTQKLPGWYPYKPDPVLTAAQIYALDEAAPARAAAAPAKPRRVLVFSRTCDFRHNQGIVALKHAITEAGRRTGAWETVVSDDLANFEPDALRRFDCVVMNNTTGRPFSEPWPDLDKLPQAERAKIEARDERLRDNLIAYVRAGGGLVGFHAGGDTYRRKEEYYAPYIEMIGGNFIGHPWTSNDTTELIVEDGASPVTRGIWPEGRFATRHETYMFGDAYDRSKLRVLVALDMDRSPKRKNARADGDCALVWIKCFGAGRVGYSAFGHNMDILFMPEIQELHMRLIQFACGDLKADTTSLAKPARKPVAETEPLYAQPTAEQIRALRDCTYGTMTPEVNTVTFATWHHNNDDAFCARMQAFLLDELASGAGTPRYRALLANLAEAVFAGKSNDRLNKLAAAEKDESVRSRLADAVAHAKAVSVKREKSIAVPAEKPAAPRKLAAVIDFLGDSPWEPMPGWLTFDALDDAMKPRLVYTLVKRAGDDAPLVYSGPVGTPALALALGYAYSVQGGREPVLERLLSFAPMLDEAQTKRMAVCIAQSTEPYRAQKLAAALGSPQPAEAALAAASLALMDLSEYGKKLIAGFDSAPASEKLAMLKVCESLADEYIYCEIMRRLPDATDAALRRSMQRALQRLAQSLFTPAMFDATAGAYKRADKPVRAFCLQLVPLAGSADAAAFCQAAFADGFKSEALRALGAWKNATALDALLAIAGGADERERMLAQGAIASVMGRAGARIDALEYLLKNAARPEDKAAALQAAVDFPDAKIAAWLDKNGYSKEAQKVRGKLKK